eukprot:sb/3473355/
MTDEIREYIRTSSSGTVVEGSYEHPPSVSHSRQLHTQRSSSKQEEFNSERISFSVPLSLPLSPSIYLSLSLPLSPSLSLSLPLSPSIYLSLPLCLTLYLSLSHCLFTIGSYSALKSYCSSGKNDSYRSINFPAKDAAIFFSNRCSMVPRGPL